MMQKPKLTRIIKSTVLSLSNNSSWKTMSVFDQTSIVLNMSALLGITIFCYYLFSKKKQNTRGKIEDFFYERRK